MTIWSKRIEELQVFEVMIGGLRRDGGEFLYERDFVKRWNLK